MRYGFEIYQPEIKFNKKPSSQKMLDSQKIETS